MTINLDVLVKVAFLVFLILGIIWLIVTLW
jgi:hypothetical protein